MSFAVYDRDMKTSISKKNTLLDSEILTVVTDYEDLYYYRLKLNQTPWPLVRKRTIPTERPPLLGEVSANFCGWRVSRGQRNGSPGR
jgi:hypothetical protein